MKFKWSDLTHLGIFIICMVCGFLSKIAENFVPETWVSRKKLEWYHSRTQEQIDRIDFIETAFVLGMIGAFFLMASTLVSIVNVNKKFIWLLVCIFQGANIANLTINGLYIGLIEILITCCIFAIGLYLYKRKYYG